MANTERYTSVQDFVEIDEAKDKIEEQIEYLIMSVKYFWVHFGETGCMSKIERDNDQFTCETLTRCLLEENYEEVREILKNVLNFQRIRRTCFSSDPNNPHTFSTCIDELELILVHLENLSADENVEGSFQENVGDEKVIAKSNKVATIDQAVVTGCGAASSSNKSAEYLKYHKETVSRKSYKRRHSRSSDGDDLKDTDVATTSRTGKLVK